MLVNFVFWSPLISILCIGLLFPLQGLARNALVIRSYAAIFLFPALISSFYLWLLVKKNDLVISKIALTSSIPLIFGLEINTTTAFFTMSLILSLAAIIFFIVPIKMALHVSTAALCSGLLILINSSMDHFIKFAVLSIGTIIMNFMLLHDSLDKKIVRHVTADFVVQRASDFMGLVALLLIMINSNSLSIHFAYRHEDITPGIRVLFVAAIGIKLIALIGTDFYKSISPGTYRLFALQKIYYAVGTQLVLFHIAPLMIRGDNFDRVFTYVAIAIVFFAIIGVFILRRLAPLVDLFINVITSLIFLAICSGHFVIAQYVIACVLLTYPFFAGRYVVKKSTTNQPGQKEYGTIIKFFLQFPLKISYLFSRFVTNFLNPILTSFLFYRVPQIIIIILQMPLRALHNGNIQRSLIFVSFILMAYFYWWGRG